MDEWSHIIAMIVWGLVFIGIPVATGCEDEPPSPEVSVIQNNTSCHISLFSRYSEEELNQLAQEYMVDKGNAGTMRKIELKEARPFNTTDFSVWGRERFSAWLCKRHTTPDPSKQDFPQSEW
jgi:hypothetical protein